MIIFFVKYKYMREEINNGINYILDKIIYPIYDYTANLFIEC